MLDVLADQRHADGDLPDKTARSSTRGSFHLAASPYSYDNAGFVTRGEPLRAVLSSRSDSTHPCHPEVRLSDNRPRRPEPSKARSALRHVKTPPRANLPISELSESPSCRLACATVRALGPAVRAFGLALELCRGEINRSRCQPPQLGENTITHTRSIMLREQPQEKYAVQCTSQRPESENRLRLVTAKKQSSQ